MTLTAPEAMTLGTIIEGILYGAYVVLFTLYLVLRRRNHCVVDGLLTHAQMVLFGLCTTCFCLDAAGEYFSLIPDAVSEETYHKLTFCSMVLFAVIDCSAQMILLYRCWIVWDRRWVVVAVPGFLAFVTLGGGFAILDLVSSPLENTDPEKLIRLYLSIGTTAYSISLGVNALTTSLLVTKIPLISRETHRSLGSDSSQSPHIITAVLIESGLLMFAFQLAFVVLFSTGLPAIGIITGPITQIYGITPTLLDIRVITGSAYDKTTEKTRSLRFAHSRGAATQSTGTSMNINAIQSLVIDIDLDEVSTERAADVAV